MAVDLVISVDFSLSFRAVLALTCYLDVVVVVANQSSASHQSQQNHHIFHLTFPLFNYQKVTLKLICIRSPVKKSTQFDVLGASNIRLINENDLFSECKLTDICHLDATARCNLNLVHKSKLTKIMYQKFSHEKLRLNFKCKYSFE